MSDPITEHGWTAVPVDPEAIFNGKPYVHKPAPILAKDIHFPSDEPIVAKVQAYAKERLAPQAYNHSMRVFCWSTLILAQQFPSAAPVSPATLALTCLLHDIGTAPSFLTTTHMSFDFYGGIVALNLLTSAEYKSPQPQAEAVAEAIIRHQDLGAKGTITLLGQVLQLATVYDNVGTRPYLVHDATRDDVTRAFPRGGWGGCFAAIIREEVRTKPWAHSTHIGGVDGEIFANGLEGNVLMQGYE